ncbi:MAG TPA: hypothetical protein VN680_07865 [Burkholderiaceae bacterium]|nr:hypothetical protein [Burkholderiaceae bacterium]
MTRVHRLIPLFAMTLSLLAGTAWAYHDGPHQHGGVDPGQGLDPGLGSLHHAVSTREPQAQAYFDQGLRLVYAFNHEGAVAAFTRASQLDPNLAMAHWGIAYALGPNYNLPMAPEAHARAFEEVRKAQALRDKASPAERDYIEALSKRYSSDPKADTGALNLAYEDAMAQLSRKYPKDVDAAVLYAESLMDLRPWKLWRPDGTPEEGTTQIVAVLERALRLDPNHLGANHYYIHAMEMSPDPGKALASARRLEVLAPSAGHLMHMPAHIYIRTGDYISAARVNEAAALADEKLRAAGVQSMYTLGYYGHNLHFLAVSYGMAGQSRQSADAARKLASLVAPQLREIPFLDTFYATPAQVLVLSERWGEILALEEPPSEARISLTMHHFARALALAATGHPEEAQAERSRFAEVAATAPQDAGWGNNSALDVLAVAGPYLDGRLAWMAHDLPAAVRSLRIAAAAEDKLAYDEPSNWYLGSHWMLGRALLDSGDAKGAEAAFREDLKRNILSGRSLFGLRSALVAQGRAREAAAVGKQFELAWRSADIPADH